jgi:hypothetical protein
LGGNQLNSKSEELSIGSTLIHKPCNSQLFAFTAQLVLDFAYAVGIQTFFALLNLVSNAVIFADGDAIEAGDVYEDVFARLIVGDKAKPFGFVKKLDGTCIHTMEKN